MNPTHKIPHLISNLKFQRNCVWIVVYVKRETICKNQIWLQAEMPKYWKRKGKAWRIYVQINFYYSCQIHPAVMILEYIAGENKRQEFYPHHWNIFFPLVLITLVVDCFRKNKTKPSKHDVWNIISMWIYLNLSMQRLRRFTIYTVFGNFICKNNQKEAKSYFQALSTYGTF